MGSVGAQLRAEAPGGFGFYFFGLLVPRQRRKACRTPTGAAPPWSASQDGPSLTLRLVLGVLGITAANHARRKEIPLGVIIIYVIPDPFLIHASLREAP